MTGFPTPRRLRVIELGMPLVGFPEQLESGVLTTAERHLYHALALQRLEAGRLELEFAAPLATGMGSNKPAAA
jgi:hypothetical protein